MPFFEVSEENTFRWYITSAISRTFNFLNVTMTDFVPWGTQKRVGIELGIRKYFLALPSANLRWKELPYIINKLIVYRLSDEELKI